MSNAHPMVTAINAFNDNYIWALANNNNEKIALVDPGDAAVCIEYIEANNLILSTILITHHHSDHVGGIEKLLE
ncbi:MAG: MBL fold metallo-hydrolase, partial [Colwellia sp.]|nr:MBL fold metallo-hydrolase [Colwellia sp.]